jgi:hypothetical protein
MESTQIVKAEGKCNKLNIENNCGCNVENFDQGTNKNSTKKDAGMCSSFLNNLPISIADLRLIMYGVIGVIGLYLVYHFLLTK